MKKHYTMQGRIEQVASATFKAVVTADCVDRSAGESEAIESYASTQEDALRMLVSLAATLSAAIRMRGDTIDGLQIEGQPARRIAGD